MTTAEHGILRAVAAVCMLPRCRASAETLRQRRAAVATQTGTTHRPDLFQPTDDYEDAKRTSCENSRKPIAPAEMNPVRWRLVDGNAGEDTDVPALPDAKK